MTKKKGFRMTRKKGFWMRRENGRISREFHPNLFKDFILSKTEAINPTKKCKIFLKIPIGY
ncbi:MAG: hypothetical protein K6343_01725 [Caldisericaceae bacterium]